MKPSKQFKRISEQLKELDDKILLADGFEQALIGAVTIFNHTVACYDRKKCIDILMTRDGLSREDAEEHFEFNVVGSYVGDHTPAFLTTF